MGKSPDRTLHLDHGDSFELVQELHRQRLLVGDDRRLASSYEENVALTKQVVDYAHQHDVTVEGELGVLAGVEDEVSPTTTPTPTLKRLSTSLPAPAATPGYFIGTSHGAYKFTPEQCTRNAEGKLRSPATGIRCSRCCYGQTSRFPHRAPRLFFGSQEEVDTINMFGGKLPDAIGIPEEQLRKAAKSAVLQNQHRLRQPSCNDCCRASRVR